MAKLVNDMTSWLTKEYYKRELLRDLRAGECRLKERKETYLPMMYKEDPIIYENRVNNSYLYNVVDLNIQKLSSKPFIKPATINTDSVILKELEKDFDHQDHTITDFARNYFEDALWYAQAHVFVDMPVGIQRADGTIIRDPYARPNATIIDIDNILDARPDETNSEIVFLRFREYKTVYRDFDDIELEVIKLYYKMNGVVYFNIFEQVESQINDFVMLYDEDQVFGLDYIPLVSLYPMSTRVPFRPSLFFQNMANIQRAYFKTNSDQRNLEQILMCPILLGYGFKADTITVSSYNALIVEGEDGVAVDLKWVETNGQGLAVADRSLSAMRDQMESIGVDLQTRAGGNQTATANVIDQANNNSVLSCMAVALKESMEKIVYIYKDWFAMNSVIINEPFSVDVVTKFDIKVNADEINYLNTALTLNILSKEDYFNEGKRRGIIDSELTFAETQEKLNSDLDLLQ